MDKKEILAFTRENPECFLATSDGKQPRVRVITMSHVDEDKLMFVTGKQKDLFKELVRNPNVELLFWNPEEKGLQIRIRATVELSEDLDLKKDVVEEFTFLKPWARKEGYDQLAPFFFRNATAFVWSWERDLETKQYINL